MEDETTWKITGMKFYDPDDLKTVVKAEVGVTGKFLSFVSESPTGIRHRVDLSVIASSPDGTMRRLIKGKVIRGLNERSAKRIIGIINHHLGHTGKILMIARRETSDNRETIIYKLRDKELTGSHDDQQTPTLIMAHDKHLEITAVTPLPPWYANKRRGSDLTK
jgi:formamidopyrimidine-DNA glycosylase